MATGDKIVTLDDLKVVNDKFDGECADLRGAIAPVAENAESIFLGLRKYYFPSDFDMACPVNVYTDGSHYITDFNADNFKTIGGATRYVSQNGSGAGTTPETPGSLGGAINNANPGDTIIVADGVYCRDNPGYTQSQPIRKSINIIAQKGAVFIDGNYMTYTKTEDYTNVYNTSRSLTKRIIDTSISGKYIPYTELDSISAVDEMPGSWYVSGSDVYVHAMDSGNPTGKVINCIDYEKTLDIDNSEDDVKVYIENITLVGKFKGVLIDKTDTSNSLDVCFNNVDVILCGDSATERDGIMVYGGNVVFNKCKALSTYKDGFNYSGRNLAETACVCNITEIDCVGAGCGHYESSASMNGSTGHQGAKIVRINGKYYDNNGGSVADVQANTQSVNIGCIAFSPYTTGGYSQNFTIQQAGAEMWLEGCLAVGAKYDIFCADDGTIHANNTAYETKSIYSQGTFVETGTKEPQTMMLLKGMMFSVDL